MDIIDQNKTITALKNLKYTFAGAMREIDAALSDLAKINGSSDLLAPIAATHPGVQSEIAVLRKQTILDIGQKISQRMGWAVRSLSVLSDGCDRQLPAKSYICSTSVPGEYALCDLELDDGRNIRIARIPTPPSLNHAKFRLSHPELEQLVLNAPPFSTADSKYKLTIVHVYPPRTDYKVIPDFDNFDLKRPLDLLCGCGLGDSPAVLDIHHCVYKQETGFAVPTGTYFVLEAYHYALPDHILYERILPRFCQKISENTD